MNKYDEIAGSIVMKNRESLEYFFNSVRFFDLSVVRAKVLLKIDTQELFFHVDIHKNLAASDHTVFDSKYEDKKYTVDEYELDAFLMFVKQRIYCAFLDSRENDIFQSERG